MVLDFKAVVIVMFEDGEDERNTCCPALHELLHASVNEVKRVGLDPPIFGLI
jgi:hypothetical protein